MTNPLFGHLPEATLAELADGVITQQRLSPAERRHLEACDRCFGLLEGHRRAGRLLAAGWQMIALGEAAAAAGAPTRVVQRVGGGQLLGGPQSIPALRLAQLAAVVALVAVVGYVLWNGSRLPAIHPGATDTPGPSVTAAPSPTPATTPLANRCNPGATDSVGWPGTPSAPGPAAEVRPGLIAGWSIYRDARADDSQQLVLLIDPVTGAQTQVTTTPLVEGSWIGGIALWSPDGDALAVGWAQNRCPWGDVFVASGGSLLRPVGGTVDPWNWSWSPDSSQLAVVRNTYRHPGITGRDVTEDRAFWGSLVSAIWNSSALWLVPQDGGAVQDLGSPCDQCRLDGAHFLPDEVGGVVWSPDGSRLAVIYSVHEGDPVSDTDVVIETGVAFIDPGGRGWRRHAFADTWLVNSIGWVDDGHFLVNARADDEGGQLYLVPADHPDGAIAFDIDVPSATHMGLLRLSPDRSRLLVMGVGDEVAAVDIASGDKTVVYAGAASGVMSVWSWDSSALAVVTGTGDAYGGGYEQYELSVFELGTGELRPVWMGRTDVGGLTWSPDSSQLAISGIGRGLWIVNRDGSQSRRISDTPLWGMSWQPVWP